MKRTRNYFDLDVFYADVFDIDVIITTILLAQKDRSLLPYSPIIIDISEVPESQEDFNVLSLKLQLKKHNIILAAIAGVHDRHLMKKAESASVGVIQKPGSNQAHNPSASASDLPIEVIDKPIRSGQQVYAKGKSLVIFGNVGHGAEVICDGHLFVFGALQGKGLAGSSGLSDARIIAKSLNPELISIDGNYMLSDRIPKDCVKQFCRLEIINDRLTISLA